MFFFQVLEYSTIYIAVVWKYSKHNNFVVFKTWTKSLIIRAIYFRRHTVFVIVFTTWVGNQIVWGYYKIIINFILFLSLGDTKCFNERTEEENKNIKINIRGTRITIHTYISFKPFEFILISKRLYKFHLENVVLQKALIYCSKLSNVSIIYKIKFVQRDF